MLKCFHLKIILCNTKWINFYIKWEGAHFLHFVLRFPWIYKTKMCFDNKCMKLIGRPQPDHRSVFPCFSAIFRRKLQNPPLFRPFCWEIKGKPDHLPPFFVHFDENSRENPIIDTVAGPAISAGDKLLSLSYVHFSLSLSLSLSLSISAGDKLLSLSYLLIAKKCAITLFYVVLCCVTLCYIMLHSSFRSSRAA